MKIDNDINEKLVFRTRRAGKAEDGTSEGLVSRTADTPETGDSSAEGLVLQRYGNFELLYTETEEAEEPAARTATRPVAPKTKLSKTERLGLKAFQLRNKASYKKAKSKRPRNNEPWDMTGCIAPPPKAKTTRSSTSPISGDLRPTSAWLGGSVAVGTIIVNGPTPELRFTAAQEAKVVAEVQAGLSYLAAQGRAANISFSHDIHVVNISAPADPNAADKEALWRDPVMQQMGYEASWGGVVDYVQTLRSRLGTQWAYAAFFVKYPLHWFAYANIGGPRLVMHYDNDGWGPDNIDRLFVHETGHIFGCPDEYGTRNCSDEWGRFREPNRNAGNCAGAAKVPCIMDSNNWGTCQSTRAHLGWSGWAAPIVCVHSNLVLDVEGESTTAGAKIHQWSWHGRNNQRFLADPLEDGSFRLIAENSGLVLDVEDASTAQGAKIRQWPWYGGNWQRFWLEKQPDHTYLIRAKHSGLVLSVGGGGIWIPSTAQGVKIIQWPWNGGNHQRFRILSRGVSISAVHSDLVLNVRDISFSHGAAVTQSSMHGGENQRFRLDPLADGSFRILAEHSGQVLSVEAASTAPGAKIHQWSWQGGNNQRYNIEHLGNGIFKIVAKHSGLALSISGASASNGAELVQETWNGGSNQKFRLI